jgi:hypothetical protein
VESVSGSVLGAKQEHVQRFHSDIQSVICTRKARVRERCVDRDYTTRDIKTHGADRLRTQSNVTVSAEKTTAIVANLIPYVFVCRIVRCRWEEREPNPRLPLLSTHLTYGGHRGTGRNGLRGNTVVRAAHRCGVAIGVSAHFEISIIKQRKRLLARVTRLTSAKRVVRLLECYDYPISITFL